MIKLTKSKKISQDSLRDLVDIRQEIATRKSQVSNLKAEIRRLEFSEEDLNNELCELIKEGHKISRGKFDAQVIIKEHFPRLAWKQVFIKFIPDGAKKAEQLLNSRTPEQIEYVEVSQR